MSDINKIKDKLRRIDDEIEGIKRDIADVKRLSPIDEQKVLPIGLTLLLLGSLLIFGAAWSYFYQLNIFLSALNFILSIPLIYFGWLITRLGFKFKRLSRRAKRVLRDAEEYKSELERQIAENQ